MNLIICLYFETQAHVYNKLGRNFGGSQDPTPTVERSVFVLQQIITAADGDWHVIIYVVILADLAFLAFF